jgi:uncharacterized protein
MKYVVLVAVLLVVYALWRSSQRRSEKNDARDQRPPPAATALPQDMVRCPVCALHLPRGEALIGREGRLYCSQEHRLRADDAP